MTSGRQSKSSKRRRWSVRRLSTKDGAFLRRSSYPVEANWACISRSTRWPNVSEPMRVDSLGSCDRLDVDFLALLAHGPVAGRHCHLLPMVPELRTPAQLAWGGVLIYLYVYMYPYEHHH